MKSQRQLGAVAVIDGRNPARHEPPPGPASGVGLAEQLRRGSRSAMSSVFSRHLDQIYNYCYRRTGSWSAAEDLSSTVFLEAWRLRQQVHGDGELVPWLYGIATNVCRNHARSARRRTAAMGRLELVETVEPGPRLLDDQVSDQVDAGRRLQVALSRLAEMPVGDQDVFILICWEELTYPQAAQVLGIPVGTVRSRLARVRRALRLTDDHIMNSEDGHHV